ARTFYAHGPVYLDQVKLSDLDRAIGTMALSADQESKFRDELATLVERSGAPNAPRITKAILGGRVLAPTSGPVQASAPASPAPAPASPATGPAVESPAPAVPSPVAVEDAEFRLPMAWLTLWDFRDEDGDVVRVVSSGYTRLVPIIHQPVTLALPVPAS